MSRVKMFRIAMAGIKGLVFHDQLTSEHCSKLKHIKWNLTSCIYVFPLGSSQKGSPVISKTHQSNTDFNQI